VNNSNVDTVGAILKQLRVENGLKQEDLAKMLNVKRQTYSAWERDVSSPDIETISFLADFYKVNTAYLLAP
jgi:transcriptional regulator with XRE-family HTH domain